MGWDERRDVVRADARDETPHRSRKDRRAWCRGKIGVEHQPVIKLDKFWERQQRLDPAKRCRWSMWVIAGRPVDDRLYWHCLHQELCSGCGKILNWRLEPAQCPETRPAPIEFAALQCKRCQCPLREHVDGATCQNCPSCRRFFWEDV